MSEREGTGQEGTGGTGTREGRVANAGPDPGDCSAVEQVRDSARSVVAREADHGRLRAIRETLPGIRTELLKVMRELGWFGVLVPESHGGLGLGLAEMAPILEELGKGLMAEPLCATAVLGTRTLVHAEAGDTRDRELRRCAAGERLISLAAQETSGSLDPCEIVTRVVLPNGDGEPRADERIRGERRIRGEKRFVAGASIADAFLVTALEDDGVAIYLIDADAPGVTVTYDWRVDGSPSARLTLADVAVGLPDRIASPAHGPDVIARAVDEAAVMVAAELVGVMSAALERTLDYLRLRVQFDKPLASFQVLQHRAADMFMQRELASAAVASAVGALDDRGLGDGDRQIAASRAKSRCADAGLRICRDAVQLHGAIGFTDECDVGLYLKRAMVLSAWLGTASAHRARVTGLRRRLRPVHQRSAALSTTAAAIRDAQMSRPIRDRDWESVDDERFREIAAAFFGTRLPAVLRFLPHRPHWHEVKTWYLALSQAGWLAPAWPSHYGGMGLGPSKLMIYSEELGRCGAPRYLEQGINYIGPLLIARGTETQKNRYLAGILSGEHLWCQGYSEPGAGSDLASLSTRARLEGDDFVIDGEKIWTTMAHQANHMYALVRTARAARKQEGISLLLIDMRQPGVRVRPIRNIAGHEEFCQVTLENARTHRSNLVGELNDGWRVAKTLLGFERNSIGSPRQCQLALERLERVAKATGISGDPLFESRLTEIWLEVADLASLFERFVQAVRNGATPGAEVSVMKIWATETLQRLTELLIEVAGESGAISGAQAFGDAMLDIVMPFLDARSVTISAGSSQVQRNIIAKRVLNL